MDGNRVHRVCAAAAFAAVVWAADAVAQDGLANAPTSIHRESTSTNPAERITDEAGGTEATPAAETVETDTPELGTSDQQSLGAPEVLLTREPGGSDSLLGSVDELIRVGGALAAVLGGIMLLAFVARRLGAAGSTPGRPGGVVEVLARYPLGRSSVLVLLKLDRRILLLHQHGSDLTTLTEVSEPGEVASLLARIEAGSRRPTGRRFHKLLQRAAGVPGAQDNPYARGATVDLTRGHAHKGAGGHGRSLVSS